MGKIGNVETGKPATTWELSRVSPVRTSASPLFTAIGISLAGYNPFRTFADTASSAVVALLVEILRNPPA